MVKDSSDIISVKSDDQLSKMLGVGEDQPQSFRKVSYGRGLWDNLHALEQNTQQRAQNMKAVRAYMSNFKTSLEMFNHNLNQATKQLRRDVAQPNG